MLEIIKMWDKENCYTHLVDSDIRDFDRQLLLATVGEHKVDLILANNLFHWLFHRESIKKAFGRCYEILDSNGGCLAASIAASGTGHLFRQAYQQELFEELDQDGRDKWQRHLDNPIGVQSLDVIVQVARECGFKISIAELHYEPIIYDSTDLYVEDARDYGEEVFMAPLLAREPTAREAVWDRIKRRFRSLYLETERSARYLHDQFMAYLVAVRRD
jgi:hypothetical protein